MRSKKVFANDYRSTLLMLLLVVLFSACSSGVKEKVTEEASGISDSAKIDSTVRGFFRWYGKHVEELNNTAIVLQDTAKGYSIDKTKLKDFIIALEKTGSFDPAFSNKVRRYALYWDSAMRADQQMDGPPEGFDADLVLCSQDPEYSLQLLDTANYHIVIKGDKAECKLAENIPVTLIQKNGQWKITSLGCFDLSDK